MSSNKEQGTRGEAENASVKTSFSGGSATSRTTKPTMKSNLIILGVLIIYILFNLFGGYIFVLIEKKPTEGTKHWLPEFKREFLRNHSSCITYEELEAFVIRLEAANGDGITQFSGNGTVFYPEVWTISNAFLLAFTIASTIGYGLVTPITQGGQIFAIFFAFLSIPFTGLLAAKLGMMMAYYIKAGTTRVLGLVPKVKVASLFVTLLFGLLIYIVLPSILLTFVSNEEGWTYVNCLYCVIITLTTIGFGDYVPDPSASGGIGFTIFVLIWVVAGLAWFATIVQLIATHMSRQAKSLRKKVRVTSPPLFRRLHSNGKKLELDKEPQTSSVAGQNNKAVLVQVSDKSDLKKTNSSENINDQEKDLRESREDAIDGHQPTEEIEDEADNNSVSGPGLFHAVIMASIKDQSTQT